MDRLRGVLASTTFGLVFGLLVPVSIVLLFVTKLGGLARETLLLLERIDLIILGLFALEFVLKLVAFGRNYFFRDLGWIDLLTALPILAPLFESFAQLRTLRMARIVRFLRVIRIVRLFRSLDERREPGHLGLKTRFFLGISSITMMFVLLGAVGLSVAVERYTARQADNQAALILELITPETAPRLVERGSILGAVNSGNGQRRSWGLTGAAVSAQLAPEAFAVFPQADAAGSADAGQWTIWVSRTAELQLIDTLELTIMTAAILAAAAIIVVLNLFLSRYVTGRIQHMRDWLGRRLYGGEKNPLRVDDVDDELTELAVYVNQVSDFYPI